MLFSTSWQQLADHNAQAKNKQSGGPQISHCITAWHCTVPSPLPFSLAPFPPHKSVPRFYARGNRTTESMLLATPASQITTCNSRMTFRTDCLTICSVLLSIAARLSLNTDPQAQASLDEEVSEYPQQQDSNSDRYFTRQDSASSNLLPGKGGSRWLQGGVQEGGKWNCRYLAVCFAEVTTLVSCQKLARASSASPA